MLDDNHYQLQFKPVTVPGRAAVAHAAAEREPFQALRVQRTDGPQRGHVLGQRLDTEPRLIAGDVLCIEIGVAADEPDVSDQFCARLDLEAAQTDLCALDRVARMRGVLGQAVLLRRVEGQALPGGRYLKSALMDLPLSGLNGRSKKSEPASGTKLSA